MDIAIFVETARAKSLVAAAKTLKIDHTTAFRRLKNFEKRLGYALFDRTERDYILTLEGHKLFGLAETLESDFYAFEREAFATDISETGTIRVTAPDSLGINYLPNLLSEFRKVHPSIQVELSVRNQFLNLSKREADIAIRPASQLEGDMVARKAATMAFGLYATSAYLESNGEPLNERELSQNTICGFDGALSNISAKNWLNKLLQKTTPQYRFDNTTALMASIKSDCCIGVCPCFMADADPQLHRLKFVEPDQTTNIWVATHPEIRNTARVRAFVDFAYERIRNDRNMFAGIV